MNNDVPAGHYTMSVAAAMVPMPTETLRKWKQRNVFQPTAQMQRGKLTVALYSDEDVEELRNMYRHRVHPGGPNPHARKKSA